MARPIPEVSRTVPNLAVGKFFRLCKRSFVDMLVDKGFTHAAAIAYYAFVSLFPLLLLLISVVGFLLRKDSAERVVALAWPYVPAGSLDLIRENIFAVVARRDSLSVLSAIGLIWSASLMFDAINEAMNAAWGVAQRERFLISKLKSFLMITLLVFFVLGSVGITTQAALFDRFGLLLLRIPFGDWLLDVGHYAWSILGRVTSVALTIVVFTVVYLYLPRCEVRLRDVIVASSLAGTFWELSKHAFVWYIAKIADYSKVYGSVAAVLILLIWIHFSALVLIWGAELASEYSKSRRAVRVQVH